MRYFLATPAHEPADFRLTLHGWSIAVVENFVAPGFEPVAPDSELAVEFVFVDFAPPV